MSTTASINTLIYTRNDLLKMQEAAFVSAVKNINSRNRELLKNDFGSTLVRNCAWDAADTIVSRYLNTAEYYISVQQMYNRIVHFSYDDASDPLANNDSIRKMLYTTGIQDDVSDIAQKCQQSQVKLFVKESHISSSGKKSTRYIDNSIIERGKTAYRDSQSSKNRDEVTGKDGTRLEVDHVQAAATATYNSAYITSPEGIEALKNFYNSPDNFEMLEKVANGSKGDVRVYGEDSSKFNKEELSALINSCRAQLTNDGNDSKSNVRVYDAEGNHVLSNKGISDLRKEYRASLKEKYLKEGKSSEDADSLAIKEADREIASKYDDITYKVDAKTLADAVCERWENPGKESTKQELIEKGFLGKDGKVPKDVRDRLEAKLRRSMDAESIVILQILQNEDYRAVTHDALSKTKQSAKKILVGQIIYYVLPPLVFETQEIIRKKDLTIDTFFTKIKKAQKRVVSYVVSKLKDILKNTLGNMLHNFIRNIFDILIALVKETVKRFIKAIKQLVLALVNCVRILTSKTTSPAEKADAITKTLAAAFVGIGLEILFEYLEKQFGLPNWFMEPLQIIVTIIATNLIMLILQKADLFDVQYGLLVANIERVFDEEYESYVTQSEEIMKQDERVFEEQMSEIKAEIAEIRTSIENLDFYTASVADDLNRLNNIFDMGIDFNQEWAEYAKCV